MALTLSIVSPSETFPIEILQNTLVSELRTMVCHEMSCDEDQIELIYAGEQLAEKKKVMGYGVCAGDEIEAALSKKALAVSHLRSKGVEMTPRNLIIGIKTEVEHVPQLIDSGMDINCCFQGLTPISAALSSGNITAARHLIQKGCHLDAEEPLYQTAIDYHQIDSVRVLLDNGVETVSSGNGVSPLQQALSSNQPEIAKLFLKWGVPTNTYCYHGSSPLFEAIIGAHKDIACAILETLSDADLRKAGPFGDTPLHCSIRYSQLTVAKELLARNVPVQIENNFKYTPLQLALHLNKPEFVQLLLESPGKFKIQPSINMANKLNNNASKLLLQMLKEGEERNETKK
eukprot:TRINITY_DN13549_c0_g1_i1.p1 TRINITY_DN13549_c0_g1~~TRINITY_DN13549_c0_g1_i1.p1  ORF type:complete len:364 (+),score=64.23 TRINITY_DN13549_c0_g1_i1:60-1094(+)